MRNHNKRRPITRSLYKREKRIRKQTQFYEGELPNDKNIIVNKCHKILKSLDFDKCYFGKVCVKYGMNSRKIKKYDKLGIHNMKELYRTNNEKLAYEIEKNLYQWSWKNTNKCLNQGNYRGPMCNNGSFIVYIAYQ